MLGADQHGGDFSRPPSKAPFAPGNQDTFDALKDENRRPPVPRDQIPEDVLRSVPRKTFRAGQRRVSAQSQDGTSWSSRGPSGMRTEHLRLLLDNEEDSNKFFEVVQSFAQANIPEKIFAVLRVGQMTALKPNGGVRGIVVGDVVRRLVAKTMAKQFTTKCKWSLMWTLEPQCC